MLLLCKNQGYIHPLFVSDSLDLFWFCSFCCFLWNISSPEAFVGSFEKGFSHGFTRHSKNISLFCTCFVQPARWQEVCGEVSTCCCLVLSCDFVVMKLWSTDRSVLILGLVWYFAHVQLKEIDFFIDLKSRFAFSWHYILFRLSCSWSKFQRFFVASIHCLRHVYKAQCLANTFSYNKCFVVQCDVFFLSWLSEGPPSAQLGPLQCPVKKPLLRVEHGRVLFVNLICVCAEDTVSPNMPHWEN